MSGSSRNRGNWQPGPHYWIYMPANRSDNFVPPTSSPNPLRLLEERPTRAPIYGVARNPVARLRPPVRFLFIDDDDPFLSPSTVDTPSSYIQSPTFYTPSPQTYESVLSEEDKNKALNKLRKQFYSPHFSNIVKRIGSRSTTAGGDGRRSKTAADDDVGKRCAICLDDFESNKYVTVTPCDHMFHEECIVPWVKSQGKCPVCRYVI